VALVTGSGKKRVGWHVAEALARRGYGLVLHYHRSEAEAHASAAEFRKGGVEALALPADLADEAAVRTMIEQTLQHFGRIDVLANCAAIWQRKRLEDVTADDVRRHFEANVLGTFLCSRQVGLAMAAQQEGGCIVNLGDWAEARPYRDYAAYFASKGAIPTLTRCLAVELAARNPRVRVNAILPGPVLLPADLPEEDKARSIAGTLVQREGRPENIAQAVLFLVDNDFVTGACIPIDGGRMIG
jgi:pteridine reductase